MPLPKMGQWCKIATWDKEEELAYCLLDGKWCKHDGNWYECKYHKFPIRKKGFKDAS